MYTITV